MKKSFTANLKWAIRHKTLNYYTFVAQRAADDLKLYKNNYTKGTNDERDAFRHVYATALGTFKIGKKITQFGAELNEEKNHLPGMTYLPHEEWMDLHNNEIGVQIGEEIKKRGGSEEDLKQAVVKAMADGRVILTPFDPQRTYVEHGDYARAVTESKTLIGQEQQRELKEIADSRQTNATEKQNLRLDLVRKYEELERQRQRAVVTLGQVLYAAGKLKEHHPDEVFVRAYEQKDGPVREHTREWPHKK